MSDDTAKPDETPENADQAETPAPPKSKLAAMMKWIVLGAGVTVFGAIGAALYFSGVLFPSKPHELTMELPGPPVYYEMQRMTVDLKPSETRARPFIRVTLQIELQGDSAKQAFIDSETRILDAMQAHLRDLTAEELEGEHGTERLREDFTTITNRIIAPERAITVLYKEILIR